MAEEQQPSQKIVLREIEDEMVQSYMNYAMSVIVGRALPDVRDGLKPVHRRVLYSMYDLGLEHNKPTKKSARIVGECFVKGTQILTEKGLVSIEAIKKEDVVYTQNGKKKVKELFEMPEGKLIKIILKNGISVTATSSQKFKILNKNLQFEWKEAKNLTEDDSVVIRAEYPDIEKLVYLGKLESKDIYLNENIAYLLGQLLSDGWIEKGCRRGYPFRCGFCSDSSSIVAKISQILREEFNHKVTVEEREYELRNSTNQLLLNKIYHIRINSSTINKFLVSAFSLHGAYAKTKIIPHQIMISPKNVVYSFISGLIDGDGHIHKNLDMIHYGSISEKLIDQLQLLLQHLGILSYKYTNTNQSKTNKINEQVIKGNYPFHYLEINGKFAAALARELEIFDEMRAERLGLLKFILPGGTSQAEQIPFASNVIFSELSKKHLGSGWYLDKDGNKFRSGIKYRTGSKIRYSKTLKETPLGISQINEFGIARKLNRIGSKLSKFINEVKENKLFFIRVKKLENVLPEKTYDLEIEDDHEFIANGIISHNCLGKYHPHGDIAVYDAMIRMAQPWSLRYPLVTGQGNMGSIDGDQPAAQRYTEAKLSILAEEMLADIEKETVDMIPNFDGSLKEPVVLPSRIPNLLINGSSGIAVGMATNIPPHNIVEVCNAGIALIENPKLSSFDLIQYIKGPDFPTGGIIIGKTGIRDAYGTGRGSIVVRAKTDVEVHAGRQRIIVTEIPYQINKSSLIEQIADSVRNKIIQGIFDLRDESDKEGMRIVIELKKDANPEVVLNQLFRHSALESSFGIINLAIVNGEPKILDLKNILASYILHRREVITRRTRFELKKTEERLHILAGLIIALINIDSVVQKIKKSKGTAEAAAMLMSDYRLSEIQAKEILEMKLQKLSSLEQEKIKEENKQLKIYENELKSILQSEQKIFQIIKKDLLEIKEKYGDKRRTEIIEAETEDRTEESMIEKQDVVVTISHAGYVKRIPADTYKVQKRGGKGVLAAETREEDYIEDLFVANTHSYILFFTNSGQVHWLKVYGVPEGSRQAKGKAIVNLLNLKENEKISAFIPIENFDEQHYLVLATKHGTVKKTNLIEYSKPRQGGIKGIVLDEGDELIGAKLTDGNKELMLVTANGLAARFHEEDARSIGRTSKGVKGISLKDKDCVVSLLIAEKGKTIFTITENGFGKRSEVEEYRLINRGGVGVINIQCSDRNGNVVASLCVDNNDELMIISKNGITIRTPVQGINVIGRNTQGVKMMKLEQGDKVVSATKVAQE